MISNAKKILISLIVLFITSCSSNGSIDKSAVMKTTSTAVVGYFGYQLGDGDLLSTTVGSTLGAIVGSYLIDFINQ